MYYNNSFNQSYDVLSVSMGTSVPYSADNSIVPQKIDVSSPPEYAKHSHPYYKLLYVIDSDPFISYVDDREVVFSKNQLYLLPPFTLHTPKNHYGGFLSHICIKFYVKDNNTRKKIGDIPTFSDCSSKMSDILFEMVELAKKHEIDKRGCTNVFRNLLDSFIGLYIASNPISIQEQSGTEEAKHEFLPLIKYLYSHYSEDINLDDMANFMHMEKTHFAKKFKSKYNITPVNYLYSLRLTLSLDELMYTNISTQSLAKKMGFFNVSAYCNAFKKAYGISPTEYRKRSQNRKFVIR